MIHGTSAALEFGICHLNVKHLIILGHSQCGGIHARMNPEAIAESDFLNQWIDLIDIDGKAPDIDECAKHALLKSHHNCMEFPWLKEKVHVFFWRGSREGALMFPVGFGFLFERADSIFGMFILGRFRMN